MKTFRLIALALLVSTSAMAQRYTSDRVDGYSPTVYLISVHEVDSIYTNGNKCGCAARQAAAALNQLAVDNAVQDYFDTHRTGFQQVDRPQFVFASKNNRFSFAVGGHIELRAGYDVKGSPDNIDFVPYDIPIPNTYATRQRLMMDASTSRIFVKAIHNSNVLGRVVVFADADFHGGDGRSYRPRVRSAYVNLLGFTMGRDVTTFCDLDAAPMTVDFRGPNAYNFNFATMIRFEVPFANDHLKFGIAAEMPNVSATYNDNFSSIPQRVPDFPAYLQVAWGRERQSHIRFSGVVRNMYLHNNLTGNNTSLLGWGAQLSGNIHLSRWFQLFMNGVYGEGITPYIQDLTGSGLDFAPNPENARNIQTMPMWGWQAAAQINLSRSVWISGGYSTVRMERENGYISADEYRQGDYIFGNIFCAVTPRFKIAAEYLHGSRRNMDSAKSTANRVNLMFKYRP